jgi:hypothetical protein
MQEGEKGCNGRNHREIEREVCGDVLLSREKAVYKKVATRKMKGHPQTKASFNLVAARR